MPKEYNVARWYFLDPLHNHPYHYNEVPIKDNIKVYKSMLEFTYSLPVGNFSGLRSVLLMAEKRSSIGATL